MNNPNHDPNQLSALVIQVADRTSAEVSKAYTENVARLEIENRDLKSQIQDSTAESARLKAENEALKLLVENLKKQVTIDSLTGLSNQGAYKEAIEREWKTAQREKQPVALIIFDLDHLKKLNSDYGHQGADECLAAVGKTIKASLLRPSDHAFRAGGDEFAVILPNTNASGALQVAETIRKAIAELEVSVKDPQNPDEQKIAKVTTSVGVASMIPGNNNSMESWVMAADNAAYSSKDAGRNQVSVNVTKGQMEMWSKAVQGMAEAGKCEPTQIEKFQEVNRKYLESEKFGLSPATYEGMRRDVQTFTVAQKIQQASIQALPSKEALHDR